MMTCTICLNSHKGTSKKRLSCNHVFCTDCINTWLQDSDTCPVCRRIHVDNYKPNRDLKCLMKLIGF